MEALRTVRCARCQGRLGRFGYSKTGYLMPGRGRRNACPLVWNEFLPGEWNAHLRTILLSGGGRLSEKRAHTGLWSLVTRLLA